MGTKRGKCRTSSARCPLRCVLQVAVPPGASRTQHAGGRRRFSSAPNSANRIVVWTECFQAYKLTNTQLDAWEARGARGFVCSLRRLQGMGATTRFTGDLSQLGGADYVLERTLRDSKIVERAHEHGMKMYCGLLLREFSNPATPLVDWFDDAAWNGTVDARGR